ncbi:MAG: lysine-sensitive aspartokinase 3, partial [Aeromonadaceae bacterium]|nr:lysine-sensitive aspartokinase 3 [Aeromonadaceae bacterium]
MNQLCVAKFGGTSVANADAMSRCAQVVVNNPKTRVVVLSASAGVTNLLVDLSQGTLDIAAREDRLQRLTDIQFHILDALGQPAALTQTIRDMLDE